VPKAKSILFIAPEFMNLHELILRQMRASGHTVYFVPDRPSKRSFVKILVRKFRFLLGPYLWNHYRSALSEIPANVDEVFIIKGEALTPPILGWMRTRFTKARFQLYLWDCIRRSPGSPALIPVVDRAWTYDYDDAQKFPALRLTSNFYVAPESRSEDWKSLPVKWNLAFFGTAYADRMKILSSISQQLPSDFSFYRFVFFSSSIFYYLRKFFDPSFRQFRSEELSLTPKLGRDWEEVAKSSAGILDIHHPSQSGISIRAIEGLAMGLKVVTTNDRIRHYPFYDERLVKIIDRHQPHIDPEFLRARPSIEPPQAAKDLELSRWLERFFD
jgi:hypothetical protein